MTMVREGVTIIGTTAFGRKLISEARTITGLTMVVNDQKPMGMYVPYDVWYQIQHFVSTILERTN